MRVLLEMQWLLLPPLVLLTAQGIDQLPSHLCLDVAVMYNKGFKEYLDFRGQDAHDAVGILVQQATRFFQCDTLGKATTITLRVRNVTYHSSDASANWKAEDEKSWRDALRATPQEWLENAHHVAFLTRDPGNDIFVGSSGNTDMTKAQTCNGYTFKKASVTEVQGTSLHTAAVLAHEIAHSLTINDNYKGRCSGKHSIMGKLDDGGSNRWSHCSLDDLKYTDMIDKNAFKCIAKDCTDYYGDAKKTGCPTDVELLTSKLALTFSPFPIFPWHMQ